MVFLKIASIGGSIRWLIREGHRAGRRLDRAAALPRDRRYQVFDALGVRHFPFGLKDYRLDRFVRAVGRGWTDRLVRTLLRPFRWLIYFPTLVSVSSGYMLAATTASAAGGSVEITTPIAAGILLYVLGIATLGAKFLISAEAAFAYAMLGGYAISFHAITPGRILSGRSPLLGELQLFTAIAILTCVAGTAACFVAGIRLHGMQAVDGLSAHDLGHAVASALTCLYFAVTTFATGSANDITPVNLWGRIPAAMIQANSVALLVIVITTLTSAARRPPANRPKRRSP